MCRGLFVLICASCVSLLCSPTQRFAAAGCYGWSTTCAGFGWKLNTGSTTQGYQCVSSSAAVTSTSPTPYRDKDADVLTVQMPNGCGQAVGCGQIQKGHKDANGNWVADGIPTATPCGSSSAKACP